jgi:hypothetical protein
MPDSTFLGPVMPAEPPYTAQPWGEALAERISSLWSPVDARKRTLTHRLHNCADAAERKQLGPGGQDQAEELVCQIAALVADLEDVVGA